MMYRAHATSGFYDKIDNLVLKPSAFKGIRFDSIKSSRIARIAKSAEPGPGTYDLKVALERTSPSPRAFRIMPSKKESFFVGLAKQKEFIPSVDHYKEVELGHSKTYKPMRKPRR